MQDTVLVFAVCVAFKIYTTVTSCTTVGVYVSNFERNKETGEHTGNYSVTERIREERKVMRK